MTNNKTKQTSISVVDFLNAVKDEKKRNDCFTLVQIIKKQTGLEPKMWGPAIVGFGSHHYKYESGREGDAPDVSFSPRATSIAIYLSANFEDRATLLAKFGTHKTDKGCVHIRSLADIDTAILKKMITNHIKHMHELYPDK